VSVRGRGDFHAGHDGHGAQLGLNDKSVLASSPARATRARGGIATAASSTVRRRGHGPTTA
jgi:hypothetical protein